MSDQLGPTGNTASVCRYCGEAHEPRLTACSHDGLRRRIDGLQRRITRVCELTDTGSEYFRETFDYRAADEMPTGWRVVEAIRHAAIGGQQ